MIRFFGPLAAVSFFLALAAAWSPAAEPEAAPELRAGIIGLDTSHAIAFTRMLNAEKPQEALAGCRIVAAYPKGSPDIQSSVSRVPKYTEEIQQLGVEIVDSIDELIQRVDVVLLETNDGRPHLEQALPVLKARKPMFIDKPLAGSLADATVLIEAEGFADRGGWVVDQQAMDVMGSPYLLAHGLGQLAHGLGTVADAVTEIEVPCRGSVSRLGPDSRLGCSVERARRAGPISVDCRRHAARHDIRHRRSRLALAGRRDRPVVQPVA
jgi:hypothetical protein